MAAAVTSSPESPVVIVGARVIPIDDERGNSDEQVVDCPPHAIHPALGASRGAHGLIAFTRQSYIGAEAERPTQPRRPSHEHSRAPLPQMPEVQRRKAMKTRRHWREQ